MSERIVQRDVHLQVECDRVQRIVEGLNDSLSRRLLAEYAADLKDAQQRQRTKAVTLNRKPSLYTALAL
jgi:hypothetical protein